MLRVLMFLLPLVLAVYALIDCIQTPAEEIRHLPKIAWIVLIVVLDVIGCVAWLLYGRPKREAGDGARTFPGLPQRPRSLAPDDDPEFLRQLGRDNDTQERTLGRWEQDFRREEQRDAATNPDSGPPPAAPAGPAPSTEPDGPPPPDAPDERRPEGDGDASDEPRR